MSKFLIIANWKMELSVAQSIQLCQQTVDIFSSLNNTHVVLCPTFPALYPAAQVIKQSTTISLGAQNCATKSHGALTGEVSAPTLAEVGVKYCIVGHSERRRLFGETDAMITEKIQQLVAAQIVPILCIGETREMHDQQKTRTVLEQQLDLGTILGDQIIVAYEPVWAIGTGLVPRAHYIEQIIQEIQVITKKYQYPATQILYGGSVNETNAAEIAAIIGLDGLLVGGASLEFQKFQKIVSLSKR